MAYDSPLDTRDPLVKAADSGSHRRDIANAVAAERERCAKIAEAHKGAAERDRKAKGIRLHMGTPGYEEIVGEQRGEDIAAEMIAAAIRKA
jgi:hypothetical protein